MAISGSWGLIGLNTIIEKSDTKIIVKYRGSTLYAKLTPEGLITTPTGVKTLIIIDRVEIFTEQMPERLKGIVENFYQKIDEIN